MTPKTGKATGFYQYDDLIERIVLLDRDTMLQSVFALKEPLLDARMLLGGMESFLLERGETEKFAKDVLRLDSSAHSD